MRGPKTRSTKQRPGFPRAVRTLAAIKQKEGKMHPYIPKHLRERQRPTAERERMERPWKSWVGNGNNNWPQTSFSPSSTLWQPKNVWSQTIDKNRRDSKNGLNKYSISELSFYSNFFTK